MGIDYDRIPGEHMLTVYFDEKATWEYSYRWEQSFEQRHIEEIYSGDEFINQLTVIFFIGRTNGRISWDCSGVNLDV